MKTAILVGGFIMSGKTAMRDFFAEINSVDSPIPIHEIIILAYPNGLLDLESSLLDNWNPYFSDIAIKRFLNLIRKLDHKYSSPYFYKDHNLITKDFTKISREYVESLCDFTHRGMWYGINTPFQKVFRLTNQKLNKRVFDFYQKPMYFSSPSPEEFYIKTRNYTSKLLESVTSPGNSHYIIMEAYVSLNFHRVINYFDSAKMLISKRDPRDAFVELHRVFGDYYPIQDVGKFITAYKKTQEYYKRQKPDKNNVLMFNFEDLILHYEDTKNEILKFLGIDKSQHVNRQKYFDPNVSIKNVGIWKKYKNQDDIDKIYTHLTEYCYQGI